MFAFGMFDSFLLSACCIPHTYTHSCQMLFLACKLSSCRSVFVALVQLDVADNSCSTHTTTTQLQLVSQGKDAVIGSCPVALVVLAQRGKKRSGQFNSALVTFAQRGKKRSGQFNSALVTFAQRGKRLPKQTLQKIWLRTKNITSATIVTVNLDLFRAVMAVQKLANGWRARRKKDGKTLNGPLRATEVAANEDGRQMEEAAAVSSERLQEVFDRLLGSLSAPDATAGPSVTQHGSNWRARVKVGRATVNGPTRQTKAAAEEDARLLQQAQEMSTTEVEKVAQRLQKDAAGVCAAASVTKHGSGWRARVRKPETTGPTRSSQAVADADARQLQAALEISTEELQTVAQRLQREAVEVVARSSREARFDEVILTEMRDALGLQRQQKRARLRAKNVADDFDSELASKSVQLLVSAFQDVEALAPRSEGAWMVELGFHSRLDYGSRPAWTSGLERGTAHAGLKNLGNSCWLNAVLQCFRWTRSLYNAFTARLMECEESILGSLVQDVLQKLASDDWDYVAPFALLNQLYATYQGRFRPGESADAAEACRLLLDRSVYGSDIVHLLPTSIALARRGVTLTELTREHFATCRPSSDVVILEVAPVDGGRMNWSQLLVTPPAGEAPKTKRYGSFFC